MILMKLVKWRLKRVILAAELNVIIFQYQSWFYTLISLVLFHFLWRENDICEL